MQYEKPIRRGQLRQRVGKEYFILKRKLDWFFSKEKFSIQSSQTQLSNSLFVHKSLLLRPLKDVDMQLQVNKITNLKLAVKQLDGVIIKPGEKFSIWKLTGRPDKKSGYLKGLILENGKIKQGIGGGLCQLGNLIYWIALHSPLTITERWRHSYDVFPDINRTIPFGCGATLSYNYVDLQLFNSTNQNFQIKLWVDDEYLNGQLLTDIAWPFEYTVLEKEHKFEIQWWGGYSRHNKIYRTVRNINTGISSEEFVTENHATMMYNPVLTDSN